VTVKQFKLGRHALGLPNRGRKSYRNHFVAGETHDDYADWMEMVATGDAVRINGGPLTGGDFVFRLTSQGATTCLMEREKLSEEDFPQVTNDKSKRGKKGDGRLAKYGSYRRKLRTWL
jgi:hypothetical protein